MIFYFTGTGNSKHVAERLGKACSEEVIEMTVAEMELNREYILQDGENVGFVFPVYWYSVPIQVKNFVSNLKIQNKRGHYTYAVVTYGGSAGKTLDQLGKMIALDAKFGLPMVDNYVLLYDVPSQEKQREINKKAEKRLELIIKKVQRKEKTDFYKKGLMKILSPITKKIYYGSEHAKDFYTTETCNGCGQCVRKCPCKTIEMQKGKPEWKINGSCTQCLRCLHECPQKAIQTGKGTEKRGRYGYTSILSDCD